jgi:tRNA pseudouridine38-40 synthase
MNMERIKCVVAYDGNGFAGYQAQPKERTVQGVIEKVLEGMHRAHVRVHASGRTDATVHAVGQVLHFDTTVEMTADRWKYALNAQLPEDIWIVDIEKVDPSFHARYNAIKKEYRYKVWNSREKNIFGRNYHYHYPYLVSVEAMREAASYLIGTHDFTAFCSAKSDKEDKVRTIYEINILQKNEEIIFEFVGNGFLYNMVRIMMGTLLDIGQGRYKPAEVLVILERKDRSLARRTVPGYGLYLWEVTYNSAGKDN